MAKSVRLQHKEFGTIIRITSVASDGYNGLTFRAKDETHGGTCYLSLDQWATGNWEVIA